MFGKILERTEEAMTQLRKTLSSFDQDFCQLKVKFEEQISVYHKRVADEWAKFSSSTQNENSDLKKNFEEMLTKHKAELNHLIEEHQAKSKEIVEKDLLEFSKTVKTRFESMYAEYEVEAAKRAEGNFQTDLEDLFKRYGDKIAPYIFKAIMRYIWVSIQIWKKKK